MTDPPGAGPAGPEHTPTSEPPPHTQRNNLSYLVSFKLGIAQLRKGHVHICARSPRFSLPFLPDPLEQRAAQTDGDGLVLGVVCEGGLAEFSADS